jgi:hypothetical protein
MFISMNRKKNISSILFVIFATVSYAQINDAGLWINIGIEKKITQAWSLEYEHSTRLNENISEAGSIINEIGVNYRLNKQSQLSLFYRLNIQRQLNNMYVPVNRFYLDFSHRIKPGTIVITGRLRFQHQQKNSLFYDFDGSTTNTVRPKISLKYPVANFSPYLSGEVYVPIFHNEYKPIDKIRVEAGLEYDISKQQSVDLGYLIQREFFENNPKTDFIIQLGYSFSF